MCTYAPTISTHVDKNETSEIYYLRVKSVFHQNKGKYFGEKLCVLMVKSCTCYVRNGAVLRELIYLRTKRLEVTKHWNRRSDTEELRNEYQIYIHEV
jgi:hypothetical protein